MQSLVRAFIALLRGIFGVHGFTSREKCRLCSRVQEPLQKYIADFGMARRSLSKCYYRSGAIPMTPGRGLTSSISSAKGGGSPSINTSEIASL